MDACPKNLERFVDLDKCLGLIDDLNARLNPNDNNQETDRLEGEKLFETFRKTIDTYQEQPELLDPYLSQLVNKLTASLDGLDSGCNKYHLIFKFLYQLIKLYGFKGIGKKFPHETNKLPLLIELLEKEDPQDKINWQTRYVLTVWLSIVVLTPFDLTKFDSDSTDLSISNRIYTALIRSLSLHDSSQYVTSFCLAKFFSRPDAIKSDYHLSEFTSNALDLVKNIKLGSFNGMDDVLIIGHLRTLCYMSKFMPRNELKQRCNKILDVLVETDIEKINRELVNHLIIKLIQRAGLALLPKRVASWQYKRGARILGQISSEGATDNSNPSIAPTSEQVAQTTLPIDDEEELLSADKIESILSVLFVAIQNAHTKIRYSAAKGVARLASRLSRERASDVIDVVLENFFQDTSSEFAWHGGCLTLAEMSRNGLILEEKLEKVTKLVGQAIIYDKIKGSFAVGAHVRESACYVFWAMARTYEDHLLAQYISEISINLLCTMLFDRELQCRRAAAATFQELVGRQGTFSEQGIAILTNLDYQNVGQRQLTYLHLALQVASYDNRYCESFVRHLLDKKLAHWDVQIRRLASDSLSALMLYSKQDFVRSHVIPLLMKTCEQDSDNNVKHGAILGLAKTIRGLVSLEYFFDQELIDFAGTLVAKCEKQLRSKQQAPNFYEAVGHMIQSAEAAGFKYLDNSQTLEQWESLTLYALDSDNPSLRDIGSDSLLALYRTFYKTNKSRQDQLLTRLNKSLTSVNESTRCGCLRALSRLGKVVSADYHKNIPSSSSQPVALRNKHDVAAGEQQIRTDADTPDIIFTSLTAYIAKETREKSQDLVFAQAKAEACAAFVEFSRSLDKSQLILSSKFISAGFEALIERSEDYTIDKRGDIGVVVRRAAVKALQELTTHLLSIGLTSQLSPLRLKTIVARILQQAVSYNNSARELAAISFYKLLQATLIHELDDSCIPHRGEILHLLDEYGVDDQFNWRDDSTPIFVSLLEKPEYAVDLWIGLLPSVGQISDLCAKQFRDALSNYIQSLGGKELEIRNQVFNSFLDTLERRESADRLLTPGLVVADYLLSQGLLIGSSQEFQERLVEFFWISRACGEPKRLISISSVLSSMLQFPGPVQRKCLAYCLNLLTSGYSKVRVHMAEQLYLSIMTYQSELEETLALGNELGDAQDDVEGQESAKDLSTRQVDGKNSGPLDLNIAMDLLRETNWAEPLDKVKSIREQICSSLMVKV